MDGLIAEAAIWNVVLSDAEMDWLAAGYSPLTLTHRIGNLVMYQDMIRNINRPGIGPTLTNNGSTLVAPHTRMIYPASPQITIPAAPVPTGVGIRNPFGGPMVLRNPLGA